MKCDVIAKLLPTLVTLEKVLLTIETFWKSNINIDGNNLGKFKTKITKKECLPCFFIQGKKSKTFLCGQDDVDTVQYC